jgi:tetratricopeptide (TPR) repeat protein
MRPRGTRRHALRLACLLACVGAAPAVAQGLVPLLILQAAPRPYAAEQALRQLEDGDFEGAVATLQRGLDQPDLSDEELAELYRVLGLAQLYLGREDQAREAYEKLLQAQPDYELPQHEAPKIRALYARIKEDIKRRRVRPVTLAVEPPAEVEGGGPAVIEATVKELALGSRPRLYYRRAGRQSFSSVDFKRDPENRERYRALIPSFELPLEESRYEVEYYVEVADAAQRRLAGRGDALNPEVLVVEPRGGLAAAHGPAWYQTPWPYVIGGAVVVGVAAGVALAMSQPQTGIVTLEVKVQ